MKDFTPKQAKQWVEQDTLKPNVAMPTNQKTLNEARAAAQAFVATNLHDLCGELVTLDDTGLFGMGKAHELRTMCSFSGSSAQSLCIGMVNQAALRHVAAQSPATAVTAHQAGAKRHIGGSILPSSDARILQPMKGAHGTFQVRPLPDLDTHGLFFDDQLLVTHPNGYSSHSLAERILAVWAGSRDVAYVMEQYDYILQCGGLGRSRGAIEQIALSAVVA